MLTLLAALAASPAVDAYLNDILRDPETARVEQVKEPSPFDWKRACLEPGMGCKRVTFTGTMHCYRVNAKNAYGGFTGWRYWWMLERDGVIVTGNDDRYGVWKYCDIETGPSQD